MHSPRPASETPETLWSHLGAPKPKTLGMELAMGSNKSSR